MFLRGYSHNRHWQEIHGPFLKEANKFAQIICIEKIPDLAFKKSLNYFWENPDAQNEAYSVLMHQAVEVGFSGLFTKIDAGRIIFFADSSDFESDEFKPLYSPKYLKIYTEYLKKHYPSLNKSEEFLSKLKWILISLSTTLLRLQME